VAGANSPKKENYPAYMAPDAENYRGINAVRVLAAEKSYTLDKVIAAGYNRTLSAFEDLVPALLKAFDSRRTENDSLSSLLQGPVAVLRAWDFRCADTSVATTLAIEWAQRLLPTVSKTYFSDPYTVFDLVAAVRKFAANAPAADLLQPFAATIRDLQQKQGSWQVAWGSINRFQRISADIDQVYDDSKPSLPVAFASSLWGMLPSYNANYYPGTSKRYGVNGNSFICAVEFGKRIKAKSLLAGGESGDPASPHFNDQLAMYAKGQFKEVFFYKEDVLKHAEKTYHPGD
jgi:acyl-homoserine lactone acylase PvdQ